MKLQLQKQIIAALAFIFCLTNTFGQTSTKEITDKFFSLYSQDPIKAVEYAFSTNKWFEKNQEGVDNLKTKLKTTIDICGDYYGYEMLSEKTAGQSISMATFIVKYNRQPLRFTFFI
jgi:hypothetical protein